MRPAAEAKGIHLEVDVGSRIDPVRGDETRLLQIFWNLLQNAVKFTPAGGRITVTLMQEEDAAVVQVEDSGIGIAAEILPHIFDPFRQADTTSTRAYGGLGLGLALVRQLVDLHGGTVAADSVGTGHGATFGVRLPLARLRPGTEGPAIEYPVTPRSAGEPSLAGICVLVLDDDADTRMMLHALLESAGAQVAVAASTAEALAMLVEEPVDVVLADLAMPEEDGFVFMSRLRAWTEDQGHPPPAIALTAFTEERVRRLALAAGFRQYLPKPVEASTLLRAVAQLVPAATRAGDAPAE